MAQASGDIAQASSSCALLALLMLLALYGSSSAQTPPARESAPQTKQQAGKRSAAREAADEVTRERQAIAISLVTQLAEEARSFRDETLRVRVQARAADALWESDAERARSLFRRAWEAADVVDRENIRRAEEERRAAEAGSREIAVTRRGEPPNLRGEVLRLASRRDRALGEEFLTKLSQTDEQNRTNQATSTDNSQGQQSPNQESQNPENPPVEIVQRLALARQLLEEGDVERALQFADKALERVTTRGINFLSALREKNASAADQRFAALVGRAGADPASDAVTVSVLSSYAFTPFLYVVVARDNNHTSMEREKIVAPNISPALRSAFLSTAAQILLRPIAPPDQDRTYAGRPGLYFTIARLLPLFEQYAPARSAELRAQMTAVSPDAPDNFRNGTSRMLTRGLVPEDSGRDEGQEAIERADRAATSAERDEAYVRAALVAARKGEVRAREFVDKIEDTELRRNTRAYVDFTLVDNALRRGDGPETLRILRDSRLPSIQRVWVLTEVSRLLKKSDASRAAEVLDEAATEARRIGGSDPDRARALTGVATRMYEIDKGRGWELIGEAQKAANSTDGFTGEDAQIVSRLVLAHGASTTNFTAGSFDLYGIFALLAKDDLHRAVELARGFTSEAPRATASLAIVRSVLDKNER